MAIIRPEELDQLSPIFKGAGGQALARAVFRISGVDKVNKAEEAASSVAGFGSDFAKALLDYVGIDFSIGNPERLDTLPDGPFITISNHIYGHLDGICLIDILGHKRPGYKVMVNQILYWIKPLRPSFIAVNPTLDHRTAATATSINGVKQALEQLRNGLPLGLFPSGAVSDLKPGEKWAIRDREWQDPAIRLIKKAGVPVVPVRFLDRNSNFYYSLGLISSNVRLLRLCHEMFNKRGSSPRVVIGETIFPETMGQMDLVSLKAFLRDSVYSLKDASSYIKRSSLYLQNEK